MSAGRRTSEGGLLAGRRGWIAVALLSGALLLVTGQLVGSTFATSFNASTGYNSSTVSASSLSAPGSLAAAPAGTTSLGLSWTSTAGTGQVQDVSGADTTTSSACSSSTALTPLAVRSSSTASFTDANHSGASVQAGDNYCYEVSTAYPLDGTNTIPTLTTALSTSGNTTSLKVTALPFAIAAGDTIVVTAISGTYAGDSEVFTASAAAAGATTITVTAKTANEPYATGGATVVYDATSWQSWTTSSYVNTRVGFATTAVQINPSGTPDGKVDSGDKIVVTFSAAPKTSSFTTTTSDYVCTEASSDLILLGETSTSCSTTGYTLGKLTSSGGITGSEVYKISAFSISGDQVTLTIGALNSGSTDSTVTSGTVFTFTPTSTLASNSGSVTVCTSNTHASSLCLPSSSGSF